MNGPIAIVGAGAIGGTIGAYLTRAGMAVHLVDDNAEHIAAIRSQGLAIRASDEDFVMKMAADMPDSYTGALSQVFLAVKAPQTESAMAWIASRLSEDGWVMSAQNGLNELPIAQVIGRERTVGCFVNFFADVLEPGVISYGGPGTFAIGELDAVVSERVLGIAAWIKHFIPPIVTPNIWGYLWSKLAYGAILFATATTDETMADCVDHPRYRQALRKLGIEVMGLARSQGVGLMPFDGWDPNALESDEDCATMFDRVSTMMRGNLKVRSGVWRDLAVHHRKTEIDAQYGSVLSMAERSGYSMPTLRVLVDIVHGIEANRIARGWHNLEVLLGA